MLVNETIVGKDCENLRWESSRTETSGNVSDSLFFRKAEAAIHAKYGPDVYCCTAIFSHDKTDMSKQTAWPINASSGNFTTSLLMSDKGNKLVGFVPKLPCNDERLRTYLEKACVSTLMNRKKAITLLHSYWEQKYLLQLLQPI